MRAKKVKCCKKCGENIPHLYQTNDGRTINVSRSRIHCFDCVPHQEHVGKIKHCLLCNSVIPPTIIIDNKRISTSGRLYCFQCSPFGERKIWDGKQVSGTRSGPLVSKTFVCRACGLPYTQKTRGTICSTCHNREQRSIKREKVIQYKGAKCIVCGYSKSIGLDFHHLEQNDKLFTLSTNWSIKLDILYREADKCVLLCRNCHAEYHGGLIGLPLQSV